MGDLLDLRAPHQNPSSLFRGMQHKDRPIADLSAPHWNLGIFSCPVEADQQQTQHLAGVILPLPAKKISESGSVRYESDLAIHHTFLSMFFQWNRSQTNDQKPHKKSNAPKAMLMDMKMKEDAPDIKPRVIN